MALSLLICVYSVTAQQPRQSSQRSNDGRDERLQVNMYFYDTMNAAILADAALVRYNNLYSATVTSEDAGKPTNVDENIAVERDNHLLMVERRPLVDLHDSVFLKIYNMKLRNYKLEILPAHFTASYLGAFLQDSYLNTETQFSLDSTNPSIVYFTVTDAASSTPYRFRIVYRPVGALSLNFTTLSAYRKDSGIQVQWNLATETNIHHYEVEKSATTSEFVSTATVAARNMNNAAYNWFDPAPFKGGNYYRIKAFETSGRVVYSSIMNVRMGDGKGNVVVYPNPVKKHTMTVQFSNVENGKYTLMLFSSSGQQIYKHSVEHSGGSANYTLHLDAAVSKGTYQLQVLNGGTKRTEQVVVE